MKKRTFAKRILAVLLALVMVVGLMATAGAATYTVKKGDSLWRIAKQQLGSGVKWKELYEANKDQIKDPNLIFVGQELEIPGEEPAPVDPDPVDPPVDPDPVDPPVDPDPVDPEPADDFTAKIVWPDMFGDQEGTLTVKPATGEWVLNFENLYGAYEISGTYAEDGTMTCTNDAGMGTFLPLPAIYGAGEAVIKAYLNGGEVPSVPAADYVATVVWPDMFGDQEGKLTIKAAGEWILNFENLYGAYEISGTYAEDGTMTCTNDAGMGTFLPLTAIYAAGEPAIKDYLAGEVVISGDFVTGILWPDMFGDQKGYLTVKTGTSEWVLNFENLYGSYEISGTYAEDGTHDLHQRRWYGYLPASARHFCRG